MFKISDFAKLSSVPASTLRFYDELGLLKPATVDSSTGYRYYTVEQLVPLSRILALRDLGLNLEEVDVMMKQQPTAEELRGMLRLKQLQLRNHIYEEQLRLQR